MNHTWKQIDGFGGLYEVSTEGLIRSWHKRSKGQLVQTHESQDGYRRLCLSYCGESRGFDVHRLVAEAFLPNPDTKPQVNHKDGNKANNHVSNLEWVTGSENTLHALNKHLSPQIGESHSFAKLTRAQVIEIKNRLAAGEQQKSIAKDYPVTRRTVSDIKTGRKWKSVLTNPNESLYLGLIKDVLETGEEVYNRNGLCKQLFGHFARFDARDGFPLLTTKKMNFSMAVEEFLWDLRGQQNVNLLGPKTRKFWDAWALPDGNLPASYGRAWRRYPAANPDFLEDFEAPYHSNSSIDQLWNVQQTLKSSPTSRRMAVSTWMPSSAWSEPIAPCHPGLVFSSNGTHLDLLVTARSNDLALGLPWDLCRYFLLTHTLASTANLEARYVAFSWANLHLYEEHWEKAQEQAFRMPFSAPELKVSKMATIGDASEHNFVLEGYESHPFIRYPFLK